MDVGAYFEELGRKGGSSRSKAKVAAVRENVKKALAAREAKRASNRTSEDSGAVKRHETNQPGEASSNLAPRSNSVERTVEYEE